MSIWAYTGWGNCLFPDSTKSLPEPMLTSRLWGFVASTESNFAASTESNSSTMILKAMLLEVLSHLPGVNELMCPARRGRTIVSTGSECYTFSDYSHFANVKTNVSCHLTKSTKYKINLDWLSYSLSIMLIFWRSDGVKITRIWYEMMNIWDTVSTFIHLHRMFLSTDNLFEQRIGQFTLAHLYIILHNILSEINKSVPGVVTDSPYGVWGRELTTCHLGNHIWLTVRFMFQSDSWCIQYSGKGIFVWFLVFIPVCTLPKSCPFARFYFEVILYYFCSLYRHISKTVFPL